VSLKFCAEIWSPTGKARGTSMKYPPTPLAAEALRCASAKASEGYPPVAKSAEALMGRMNDPTNAYAFIHGQSPCLHAEVLHQSIWQVRVSARRRGLLRRRIIFQTKTSTVGLPDLQPSAVNTPMPQAAMSTVCIPNRELKPAGETLPITSRIRANK
jgi:hypothetical protein